MSSRFLELPENYSVLLDALRDRIRNAQVRAALAVVPLLMPGPTR